MSETRTEKLEKMFREFWFPEHKATRVELARLPLVTGTPREHEELIWAKPGTFAYRIVYLRCANRLFVSGDLGEAVYSWGQMVTLEWVADLNYDYFAEKCNASEVGREFVEWDMDMAKAGLEEELSEMNRATAEHVRQIVRDYDWINEPLDSPEEWHRFLTDHGSQCFGECWWEGPALIGRVLHRRCMGHLYGLKMAFKVEPSPKTKSD